MIAFFKYAGGKFARAKYYPAPHYRTIVEPFAGGAGYSIRHHGKQVILIDADERIVGAWDWLIKASPRDVLDLPILEVGETVDDYPLPQEARWFLGLRLNVRGGLAKTATRWRTWNDRSRSQIAAQLNLIRHWRVMHGDYTSAPIERATYFVDPPYQHKSHYRERVADYSALASWVRALPGQAIVCEGEGADWLPFKKLADVRTHRNAVKNRVRELVYHQIA